MPTGEYIVSVEPNTGTSPMYCLIEVEARTSVGELAEEAIDAFNEDFEEKWRPLYASDSDSLRIVDEDELETFIEEFGEDHEDTEYEILPLAVVSDGTYCVDWESGEERTFTLKLKQDALVRMEVFWFTEDEAEDDYPGLDELMGWKYIVVYPEDTEKTSDAIKGTQEVVPTKPVEITPTTAATPESSMLAKENMISATTETVTKETTAAETERATEAQTTETQTTETVAPTKTVGVEMTPSQAPETVAAKTEKIEVPETKKTEAPEAKTVETEKTEESETKAVEMKPEATEAETEEVIPADMSTEDIENMGTNSPAQE